jgi:heptosyltransferase III
LTNPQKIIISRTDSIGDVMLTLPVCGILKQYFPQVKIVFLAKTYTIPVLKCCVHIDEIADWSLVEQKTEAEQVLFLKSTHADTIVHVFPNKQIAIAANKANIKWRIGTGKRIYNLFNCNLKTWFSRKNSSLHESQLNVKLLVKLGINVHFSAMELSSFSGFRNIYKLPTWLNIDREKRSVVLHPKSKGSAVEWGIDNFNKLIELLSKENFNIFITGTAEEGSSIKSTINLNFSGVVDLIGKLTLQELIAVIDNSENLVAASTGPLHISAMLGKKAIGIFSRRRPIDPGRWAPIGKKSDFITYIGNEAEFGKFPDADVIRITPQEVLKKIISR